MIGRLRTRRAGFAVFVVALAGLVAAIAAVAGCGGDKTSDQSGSGTRTAAPVGRVLMGRAIFETKCAYCHYADRDQAKVGPGLKGILTKATLSSSGKPATEQNIRKMLKSSSGRMPSFGTMSDQEMADLLAYLKTL